YPQWRAARPIAGQGQIVKDRGQPTRCCSGLRRTVRKFHAAERRLDHSGYSQLRSRVGNADTDVAASGREQHLSESSADTTNSCGSRLDCDQAAPTACSRQSVTAVTCLQDEVCATAGRLTGATRIATFASDNAQTFGGVGTSEHRSRRMRAENVKKREGICDSEADLAILLSQD